MNKKYLSLLLSSVLFLSACSEKTAEDYTKEYTKSSQAAQEKIDDCKEKLATARKEKNKEDYDKLKKDIGCIIAFDELKKHKNAERDAKRAAQEEENNKILAEAESAITKEYGSLDLKAFLQIYKKDSCAKASTYYPRNINAEQARCKKMNELLQNLSENTQKTYADMPFTEFLEMESKMCQLDKTRLSTCTVWKDTFPLAVKTQFNKVSYKDFFAQKNKYCSNSIASEYKYDICSAFENLFDEKLASEVSKYNDDDKFKKTYNECYEKSKTTIKRGYLNKGQTLASDDPVCFAVNKATSQRRLSDFRNFQKPLD